MRDDTGIPAPRRRRRAAMVRPLLLALLATVGCTRNPAPRNWLPPAAGVPTDPYGGWIVATVPGDARPLSGEFLAVTSDTLYVLPEGGTVRRVPIHAVTRARIFTFDANTTAYAVWTMLGVLSTASHGFMAAVSIPVWVIVGGGATVLQSNSPVITIRTPGDWPIASRYARFPAGPPPALPATLPQRPFRARRG